MNRMNKVKYYNTIAIKLCVAHDDKLLGIDLAQAGNRISRNPASLRNEVVRTRKRLKDVSAMLNYLNSHHGGTGKKKSTGRRRPEKVPYCTKGLAILDECRSLCQ